MNKFSQPLVVWQVISEICLPDGTINRTIGHDFCEALPPATPRVRTPLVKQKVSVHLESRAVMSLKNGFFEVLHSMGSLSWRLNVEKER